MDLVHVTINLLKERIILSRSPYSSTMYGQRVGAGVALKVTTVILSQGQFLQ